jgi:adenosylcobinamide-GDP ribazoletransferase
MMMIAAGLVTCAVALIAMRKINGTTGDVLGATQQLTEISLLIILAS